MAPAPERERLFTRPSWTQAVQVSAILRSETTGGLLMLAAAAIAVGWANTPLREIYEAFTGWRIGPHALHLDLTIAQWAADGLLAIFFFVVGLELKREFVDGDLRDPRRAALPIAAAVGGMIGPAAIYLAVNAAAADGTTRGWAVPMATDIAFALAVLAIISTHLPSGLRSFLLTLAVVDDLLAVAVIVVFFTGSLALLPLAGSLTAIGVFALLNRRDITAWWLLIPLAIVAWALLHASGVHATVAGVLLGFCVPARPRPDGGQSMSLRLEHRWRPVSALFAVPVFAFAAAGVTVTTAAFTDPIALGITAGMVAGKLAGILAATWLLARFTRATLDEDLSWWDVTGLALLGGIGFTVSLLIAELSFTTGDPHRDHAKTAVLVGSLIAAALASLLLRLRNRHYRRLKALEEVDADHDGIPDVYQRDPDRRRTHPTHPLP